MAWFDEKFKDCQHNSFSYVLWRASEHSSNLNIRDFLTDVIKPGGGEVYGAQIDVDTGFCWDDDSNSRHSSVISDASRGSAVK